MTLPIALPFGLRDVKLIPYTTLAAVTLGVAMVDLPYGRTLSFSEVEEFEDLRGDDQLVTSHGSGASVEWELEAGGISLEAWAVMSGGAVTTSGISPAAVKTYRKKVTDVRPFFAIIGQVISDSGGDLHCIIFCAKATDNLEGSFEDQSFFLTSGKGKGFGSRRTAPALELGTVYDFVQHETALAIAIPPSV